MLESTGLSGNFRIKKLILSQIALKDNSRALFQNQVLWRVWFPMLDLLRLLARKDAIDALSGRGIRGRRVSHPERLGPVERSRCLSNTK